MIMSKKRIVCLLFIGCAVALSSAQSISEIKGNKDYIWGEGKGVTLTEADKEALNDLITQISVTVESKYSKIDENVVAEEGVSTQSSFKAVLCKPIPMPRCRIPNVLCSATSPMPMCSVL